MAIVVGFIDNPEGRQAVDLAVTEAERRQTTLVVVHSMRGGTHTKGDEYMASREALDRLDAELSERGVAHEIREYVRDQTPAEDLVEAVLETELPTRHGRGVRCRAAGDRLQEENGDREGVAGQSRPGRSHGGDRARPRSHGP